jgi:L-fuconolactonase
MKVDAHQHFWKYSPQEFDWITDEMAVIRRNFLPQDLWPHLQKAGFDGCVAVQASQTEAETRFLLDLADQYAFIKGVVGWVDLRAANAEARLAYFADSPKLVGFRHVVQAEPDDNFLLRSDFQRGIQLLKKHNFTYDILIFPKQLPAAIRFVEQFPDQPFVLNHIAKPLIKDQIQQPWAEQIKVLGRYPNVYCKLSGMVTEADWKAWTPAHFEPYLNDVLEAFGTDRLMIGSDWPVCKVAGEYEQVMQLVQDYMGKLSATEQQKIMGENAVKFYGLT